MKRFINLTYSKIHQIENSVLLTIDWKHTKCPVCGKRGCFYSLDDETICECGFVLNIGYPYVAGKKINKSLNYQIFRKTKDEKKRVFEEVLLDDRNKKFQKI